MKYYVKFYCMKIFFVLLMMVVVSVCFVTCKSNKSENGNADSDTGEEKQKYEVKYLEDFVQFENHDQMAEYFGEKNVIAMEWYLEEGTEPYKVSILNPGYRHKIFVYWDQESGGYTDFDFVEATYSLYDVEWKETEDEGETYESITGLFVGMSLEDMVKLNGSAIGFYGFGWDYGGYVYAMDEKFSKFSVALCIPDSYIATPEGTEAYLNLAGDRQFKSDDEIVAGHQIEICRLSYNGE